MGVMEVMEAVVMEVVVMEVGVVVAMEVPQEMRVTRPLRLLPMSQLHPLNERGSTHSQIKS
jgi:hypothetical protein